MEIFKRGKVIFIILLLIAIVIFGIFLIPKKEKNPNKIVFALDWTPNTNHTGLFVAKEKGYFEEEGIDLEFVQPPEDTAGTLVAANTAQFGIDFQDALAHAYTSDMPITTIATILQHNTSGVISLKKTGISSLKNMEGKKYATPNLPMEQAILKYCVELDGGNFSKINMIPTYVVDIVAGLQTDIDSVWIFYGWEGIATKVHNLDTNFIAFKDIDPIFDYYTPVIVGNNEFMDNNPELTKRFLKACKKGYEYAIKHPEEAAEILLKADPTLNRELVMESQKWISNEYQSDSQNWGYIDEARWNNFYKWLYDNDLIEREITGGFTNKYLKD